MHKNEQRSRTKYRPDDDSSNSNHNPNGYQTQKTTMEPEKRRKIEKAAAAVHLLITTNTLALQNVMILEHLGRIEEFNHRSEYLSWRKVRKRIQWSKFISSLSPV